MWDLSGETGMQKIWPNYIDDADAIIFCVDSSDLQSLCESKQVFGKKTEETFLFLLFFFLRFSSSF